MSAADLIALASALKTTNGVVRDCYIHNRLVVDEASPTAGKPLDDPIKLLPEITDKSAQNVKRVVTGGFLSITIGAARNHQVFIKTKDKKPIPLSTNNNSIKELVGELVLLPSDSLLLTVDGGADIAYIQGILSYKIGVL